MFDVVVANGRYFGGGMKICPEAEPDDGLFDVLTIGDITKRDLVLTMPKIYRGTHLPHPKAELLRGATVTVEKRRSAPVELDGEQPGTTPVRFEVRAARAAAAGAGRTWPGSERRRLARRRLTRSPASRAPSARASFSSFAHAARARRCRGRGSRARRRGARRSLNACDRPARRPGRRRASASASSPFPGEPPDHVVGLRRFHAAIRCSAAATAARRGARGVADDDAASASYGVSLEVHDRDRSPRRQGLARKASDRPDLERRADDEQERGVAGTSSSARSIASAGRSSPNMTTPGLRIVPQAGQSGASRDSSWARTVSSGSVARRTRGSRNSRIDPCTSTTSTLPARAWSRSMFWVTTAPNMARALERGEGEVAGVRLGREEPADARPVPAPDTKRIPAERVDRGDLERVDLRPHPDEERKSGSRSRWSSPAPVSTTAGLVRRIKVGELGRGSHARHRTARIVARP